MESCQLWSGFTFAPGLLPGQSGQGFMFHKAPDPSNQTRAFVSRSSVGVVWELPCLYFKVVSVFYFVLMSGFAKVGSHL